MEIMILINKIIIVILIVILTQTELHCYENKIIYKIDNEIITSLDLKKEINYLTTLNPSLKNLTEKEIIEISKKSISQEKIKRIEISKNFENPILPVDFLENLIKNIYSKIGLTRLIDFKNYIKLNKVSYEDVLYKIETEALWNELIVLKFSNKVKIDSSKIREKVKKNINQNSKSYLMSEIFFEVKNTEDLTKKYEEISKTIKIDGFNNAALKHSISETSKIGGKLDWISLSSLNDKIKKNILATEKNNFTKPIAVPGGFLILKINEIKTIKSKGNIEEETKKFIRMSKNNQYNQFSKMYFNRVKKNIEVNEL